MESPRTPPSLYETLPIEITAKKMFWLHRNLGKTPRWLFPDAIEGPGIRCERLTFSNFDELWPALATGDTTFINQEYRDRAKLYEHLLYLHGYAPYSAKHGAADWLIIINAKEEQKIRTRNFLGSDHPLHLGEGERLVGVLHLYDLSLERYDGKMPNPFVGIQLVPEARGQGIARRVIPLLEWYVGETYPEVRAVTAMIKPNNERSLRLFKSIGYAATEEYGLDHDIFMTKDF